MKLFIADDEQDVREGLRYILDWSALGFYICGEGKNGADTLEQILISHPDVVLMDIRMPKLSGLEVIRQAKEGGFQGKFIILSGYSDFSYAQEAIKYGVSSYLTKPIDEDELEMAVLEAKNALTEEQNAEKKLVEYRSKARDAILKDLLLNKADPSYLDYRDIALEASIYQVVIYTNYNQESFQTSWNFADILRLVNKDHNSLDDIRLENMNVILLKGDFALNRFQELLDRYFCQPKKGSPLDSLFLTYGHPVYRVDQIYISFQEASDLMKRRFFCSPNQHVLGFLELPENNASGQNTNVPEDTYSERIANYIQSGNLHMLMEVLDELKNDLYFTDAKVPVLKHYLADIMIQVKSLITHTYGLSNLPLPNNAAIISTIEEQYYLYEILQFFTVQFEMYMNAIDSPSRESVMDGILNYIHHNYQKNLKLGSIAELFGYNSSYLGKIFNKTTGKNFNSYVDEIRIENSKKLLEKYDYKVYEIAQRVGYSNVDYFHKKFNKYTGMSPAEYRKSKAGKNQSQ